MVFNVCVVVRCVPWGLGVWRWEFMLRFLNRVVLSVALWFAASQLLNCVASAQEVRTHGAVEAKDLKSVTIVISVHGSIFHYYHYAFVIRGNGVLEYHGHLGEESISGLHRTRVSGSQISRLLTAFQDADFDSLQDESMLSITDAPSTSILLSIDGRSKAITDRSGHKDFRTLADKILEISQANLWLQPNADTIQVILADPDNLNTADDEGQTVLMWACQREGRTVVRELIRSGANVGAKDKQGRTPLMYAAAAQSRENVDTLLRSDAVVDDQDSAGDTALHFAAGLASSGTILDETVSGYKAPVTATFFPNRFLPGPNPEVVRRLLTSGADPNATNFEGATPLMYAAEEAGSHKVLLTLLAARADVNAQDADGRTALMYAVDVCEIISVNSLLGKGANPAVRDKNGLTALQRLETPHSQGISCGPNKEQVVRSLMRYTPETEPPSKR